MKILVVDDDSELRPLIAYALRQAGYFAIEAGDGESALRAVAAERPDLVILDLNLPDIDGLEVCRRLRSASDRTPILMLTVRSEEDSLVAGLDAGADDYLSKPFSPRTLLARLRALLRRAGLQRASREAAGDVELDHELQAVRIGGQGPVRLAELEFRFMQILAVNVGEPVATERLLRHVWGPKEYGDRQHLKQLVHRLRQKLEADPAQPRLIRTVPGVGYVLESGHAPADR